MATAIAKKFARAKGSIALSLTAMVLAVFILVQGALWVWFLMQERDFRARQLRSRVEMAARVISHMAMDHIKQGDLEAIHNQVDSALKGTEVVSVNITTAEGRVLMHETLGIIENEKSNNPFLIPYRNVLVYPIDYGDGKVGEMELTYGGSQTNAEIARLLTVPTIWQASAFALIVLSIFLYIQKRLGSPIAVLNEKIKQITSGDLTVSVPEIESAELGTIADGLNFLVKSLATSSARLRTTAESVSKTMLSLERTFKGSMERVKKQSDSTRHMAHSVKRSEEAQDNIKESADMLNAFTSENLSSLLQARAKHTEIAASMDNLFQSTDSSYSVVAEMAQTAKIMSGNASRVLSSVENTSASVEEIIASVREVENSAKESSRLAEKVLEEASQKGMVTVDRAVNGMQVITKQVRSAVDIVKILEGRSKEIQGILSVIKEITEQTNLLSINASILAEQAGEYGKGFAVVASEMRGLSTRTEAKTKEISGIIGTIQRETRDVVSAIERGMLLVGQGGEAVYEVGESMSAILESAHSSAHMTKMIERATKDQVSALRHIEAAVIDVNTMAMEMNKAMEEMTKSTGYIHERVGEVRDVAEITKKGTDELSAGVGMISKNLELSSETVTKIAGATAAQQSLGKTLTSEIEAMKGEGSLISRDLEEVTMAIERLRMDFAALRAEMEAYRIR